MPAGAPGSWDHLIRQSGMFGFLGLSPEIVLKLKGQSLMFLLKLSCLLWVLNSNHLVQMITTSTWLVIPGYRLRA
jgi:aspartate/tyrosine/aromatic aminotransferase